jgi:hypothetical protein
MISVLDCDSVDTDILIEVERNILNVVLIIQHHMIYVPIHHKHCIVSIMDWFIYSMISYIRYNSLL